VTGGRQPDVALRTFATDAEAHQVVDEQLAALTRHVESIKAQHRQALQTAATATSRDGHVRVTVDSTGVPTELTLSQTALVDTTPEKLARTVLATAQQAAASVRASVRGAVDGIRGGDPEMVAARHGAQQLLGDLSLPEVPRTVTDPADGRDPWAGDTPPAAAPDPDAPLDAEIADLGEPYREGA
jgi:DNA-binding protein YbaB